MINLQSFNVVKYLDKKVLRNMAILLVLIIIFLMVFLRPAVNNTKHLRVKCKDVKNSLIRSRRKIDRYPIILEEKVRAEKFVNKNLARLIEEREKTRLIGDVSDLAKKCGVTIVSVRPRPYEKELPESFLTYYKPISYELALECGYHEFGKFINLVENFDYILTVERFNIVPSEGGEEIHSITLWLTTYAKV